ncbi:pyridoxamine 5'-phosphate oxidase family protein [Streptomyces sp. I05A-00742]|uniref:pyridoxamine 5'-phosphate oxidase family protein n=1 Tax=Streptomyces sp. I05A-00742 TaxID=2732853 RepID=UPI0014891C96|nr:pyridoxamine 5'-phosphate oxidase family protein [Streptomyces sp. I05A-00742]
MTTAHRGDTAADGPAAEGPVADGPAADRTAAPSLPAPRPGGAGERAMQQRLGTAERADRFYAERTLGHLNTAMREFVARQDMFFLATAAGNGACDSSFRAGPPGFLRVLDERTLAYPEYRGNGVLASLGNIEENPHVGILLVDFFRDRVGLHVNGRARVVEDAAIRTTHPGLPVEQVPGRRAGVWVEVTVEEAYIHCSKHIPRLSRERGGQGADGRDRADRPGGAPGPGDGRRPGGDFFGVSADRP